MGCFHSHHKVVAENDSASSMLKSLKSKKAENVVTSAKTIEVNDKASSESEKRSAAIETFTWEVYTYADRDESYRCIMSYSKSRAAFRNFILSKAKAKEKDKEGHAVSIARQQSEPNDRLKEEALKQLTTFEHEKDFDNQNTTINEHSSLHKDAVTFFSFMSVQIFDVQSLPLVSRSKSSAVCKYSDEKIALILQSLYLFFKSPMYLIWRAEESACVGAITATNLSMKHVDFSHESAHKYDNSLAERAFSIIEPSVINNVTSCSSWIATFIAAAENLPFALFVASCGSRGSHGRAGLGTRADGGARADAGTGSDSDGFPIFYINLKSEELFGYSRREVMSGRCRLPHIASLVNRTESAIPAADRPVTSPTPQGSAAAASAVAVAPLPPAPISTNVTGKGRVTIKMSSTREDGSVFINIASVKAVFDQTQRARFIIGIHGSPDKLDSRRDVKMLEVLLGLLPDDVLDESAAM